MDTYIGTGSNYQNRQYGNISASTLHDIWAQFIVYVQFFYAYLLKKGIFPVKKNYLNYLRRAM